MTKPTDLAPLELGWLDAVTALRQRNAPGVLITLVTVRGHAPRSAGAKMVVSAHQSWDSVGGGNLEATAVERARALMHVGATTPELLTLRLTDAAPNEYGRQCCGGEVTLLLEPLPTQKHHLAIFGVGHVGLELARALGRLDVQLHLIDSRAAQLTAERLSAISGPATLHVHHAPIPELALHDLPGGAHLVIMTHDHAEDAALCDAALRRQDLGFVGLIGSPRKWGRFQEQLRTLGHTPQALERITSPIGIQGVSGKAPAVIALSVAAQLLHYLEAPCLEPHPSLPPFPETVPTA